MKKTSQPNKADFDAFLKWLSPNKEEAGKEYEKIREGLIRFFDFRGCSNLEFLADETINRVIWKFFKLDLSKGVKKITIFYNFAFNVCREHFKEVNKKEIQLEPDWYISQSYLPLTDNVENEKFGCLDKCLDKLTPDEKELILDYYSEDKMAKINLRKKLAKRLNIKLETLHVRVYRIKKSLKKCLKKCAKKK